MAMKLQKDKIVRNLAKSYKLVTHIDRSIDEGEFAWDAYFNPKEEDDAWHPSGDCTPSLNELFLKGTGQLEERPFSVGLRKSFMVGHFWHQYLQYIVEKRLEFCDSDAIERQGRKVWEEKPYHWATGAGDVAPCAIPGFGDFLVDFKTMGAHDYKREGLPDWCAVKYECQINIYLDFFDLEQGLIVAILKDSPHDMKEFTFTRNQPLIDAIYDKWKLAGLCIADNVEPPEDEPTELPVKGPVQ